MVHAHHAWYKSSANFSKFSIKHRLRHRDSLSSPLFNTALSVAVIRSDIDINNTLTNKFIKLLEYTDDITIWCNHLSVQVEEDF